MPFFPSAPLVHAYFLRKSDISVAKPSMRLSAQRVSRVWAPMRMPVRDAGDRVSFSSLLTRIGSSHPVAEFVGRRHSRFCPSASLSAFSVPGRFEEALQTYHDFGAIALALGSRNRTVQAFDRIAAVGSQRLLALAANRAKPSPSSSLCNFRRPPLIFIAQRH
jgi:hypothetical protein